jgi:hypothetical protein
MMTIEMAAEMPHTLQSIFSDRRAIAGRIMMMKTPSEELMISRPGVFAREMKVLP